MKWTFIFYINIHIYLFTKINITFAILFGELKNSTNTCIVFDNMNKFIIFYQRSEY